MPTRRQLLRGGSSGAIALLAGCLHATGSGGLSNDEQYFIVDYRIAYVHNQTALDLMNTGFTAYDNGNLGASLDHFDAAAFEFSRADEHIWWGTRPGDMDVPAEVADELAKDTPQHLTRADEAHESVESLLMDTDIDWNPENRLESIRGSLNAGEFQLMHPREMRDLLVDS